MWFIGFDDFCDFLVRHEIKDVFVFEQLLDIEDYLITKETMNAIRVRNYLIEYITSLIEAYNESLLEEDVLIPENVFVIAVWNNQRFCFVFQNKINFKGAPLLKAEVKLLQMIEENQNEIIESNESKKQEREKQLEALKQEILSDPEFKKCTNSRFRRNYMYAVLGEECKYDLLKKHWTSDDGVIVHHRAFDFIEMLWKEYKNL